LCSIIRSVLSLKFNNTKVWTVDWNREGRVSVVELDSPALKLFLFNIYAVNGTDKPYRDPSTGAVAGTRHDRKLAFHALLMRECKALEASGREVLIAGDINVAPDVRDGYPKLRTFPPQHVINRTDFLSKFLGRGEGAEDGMNGVDVWRKMHEDERRYTYFSRAREWGSSCDRVDYVIVSRRL
jgi:exonuclease III